MVKDGVIVYDHVPIGLYARRIAVVQVAPAIAEVQLDLIGAPCAWPQPQRASGGYHERRGAAVTT